MKKLFSIITLIFIFSQVIFAQNNNQQEEINPKTGFPEIKQKPFIVFNEGVSGAMITRLEKKS